MTPPRAFFEGATYTIVRRCIFRQFLLTPCAVVNDVMLYLLAVLANRHGIEVHAFCCMSSHIHLVCTDVDRKLPAFMKDFMALSARAINAFHRRRGCFWEPEQSYDPVTLLGEEAELEALVYVHTNPVSAGLVENYEKWPGAATRPCLNGPYSMKLSRPNHFFRDQTMPDETVLRITPPPGLRAREKDELRRAIQGRIQEIEREKREEMRREGRSFVGHRSVLRQSTERRATSEEKPYERTPLVKCLDPKRREKYLEMLREWHAQYREAYRRVRKKETEVLFPYGTWWWVVFGNARVAPGPERAPG